MSTSIYDTKSCSISYLKGQTYSEEYLNKLGQQSSWATMDRAYYERHNEDFRKAVKDAEERCLLGGSSNLWYASMGGPESKENIPLLLELGFKKVHEVSSRYGNKNLTIWWL